MRNKLAREKQFVDEIEGSVDKYESDQLVKHSAGINNQGIERVFFRDKGHIQDEKIFYDSESTSMSTIQKKNYMPDWTRNISKLRLTQILVTYALQPTLADRHVKLNLGKDFLDIDNFRSNLEINNNDILVMLVNGVGDVGDVTYDRRNFLETDESFYTFKRKVIREEKHNLHFMPTVNFLYTPSLGNSIVSFKLWLTIEHF